MNYNKLINDLNNYGYAEIDNFLTKDEHSQILTFLEEKKNRFKNNNFSLSDEELNLDIFKKIFNKHDFKTLFTEILNFNKINVKIEGRQLHTVLGYRTGNKNPKKTIPMYHFDAYLITILIPIIVPPQKEKYKGELLIYPNLRKIHKFMITNFIIKILTQNFIFRYLINFSFFKNFFKMHKLNLNLNKIFFFYGYRSMHGVESIGLNVKRSTLLYHIYNPHLDTFLDNLILLNLRL